MKNYDVNQFVKENVDLLRAGNIVAVERNIRKIGMEEDRFGYADYEGCIEELLLKEVIARRDLDAIRLWVESMEYVPLLKEFYFKEVENLEVEVSENPFITDDVEILKILVTGHYERCQQTVMWQDKRRLYCVEGTPMAIALATGNVAFYEVLSDKEHPLRGFYFDDEYEPLWTMNQDRIPSYIVLVANELLEEHPGRLWSPEEAVLLSNDYGLIVKVFDKMDPQEVVRNLTTATIEFDGRISRHKVFKHKLPDAFYWADENIVHYMNCKFKELHKYYELDKILEARNGELLETYLMEHNDWTEEMILKIMEKTKDTSVEFMTFGMLNERMRRTDCHCLPHNEEWFQKRCESFSEYVTRYLDRFAWNDYERNPEFNIWGDELEDFTPEEFFEGSGEEENGWKEFSMMEECED